MEGGGRVKGISILMEWETGLAHEDDHLAEGPYTECMGYRQNLKVEIKE